MEQESSPIQKLISEELKQLEKRQKDKMNEQKLLSSKEAEKKLREKLQYLESQIESLESQYPDLCYQDNQYKEELYELQRIEEDLKGGSDQQLRRFCLNRKQELDDSKAKVDVDISKKEEQLKKLEDEIKEINDANLQIEGKLNKERLEPAKKCLIHVIETHKLVDEKLHLDELDFLKQATTLINDQIRKLKSRTEVASLAQKMAETKNYVPDPKKVDKTHISNTIYNDIFLAYQAATSKLNNRETLKDDNLCIVFAQTLILYVNKLYNEPIKKDVDTRAKALEERYNNVVKSFIITSLASIIVKRFSNDKDDDSDKDNDSENEFTQQKNQQDQELFQAIAFIIAFGAMCGMSVTYNKGKNPPCFEVKQMQ